MAFLNDYGISVPEILLPKNIDTKTWSVIACDQYTQDAKYWNCAREIVGEKPSTLNFILPEIYLNEKNVDEKIATIKNHMQASLTNNIFEKSFCNFVLVERTTRFKRKRLGLLSCIDLEKYDWNPESRALIRATEKTIPERIPPRKKIRQNAALESPHIMLLANDKNGLLIENTFSKVKNDAVLYEGDLMLNGGSVRAWKVPAHYTNEIESALSTLATENTQSDGSVFLFAVGDGNHSLATAKSLWEDEKKKNPAEQKSARRFALVEIENIYDKGLNFEPIHRVLFNVNAQDAISFFQKELNGVLTECENRNELLSKLSLNKTSFGFIFSENGTKRFFVLETKITSLAVSVFQPLADKYMESEKKVTIDFIHGSDEVFALAEKKDVLGILLPAIDKDNFFASIHRSGVLPRKSFSIGEADEKRFYLECRKLYS